jgi:nitronate monooxygenase
MATKEAPIHQNVKEALIDASELDTKLIMRSLRNTERVLNNKAVEEIVNTEKELGTKLNFSDIEEQVAGVYPKVMQNGEMDIGAWSCGMVVGLINDIPTVKELIDRVINQAQDIHNSNKVIF